MTNNKVETKRMGNFDMAAAGDRIKAFWEKYPSGKISTAREKDEDGMLVFKAYIWKDKKDYLDLAKIPGVEDSVIISSSDAEANAKQGSAKYEKKDFEKLETIAIGRALAVLGFLKDGQVASTEEMEEFKKFKEDKEVKALEENVEIAIKELKKCKSLADVRNAWIKFDRPVQKDERVGGLKEDLKKKFEVAS